jgi:hypothetical protein
VAPLPGTGIKENTQRFAVARIRGGIDGQSAYLAVQSDNNWDGDCQASFRLSYNLVDWGPRAVVWTRDHEGQCAAQYLILAHASGGSNEEIDLSGFRLIGGAFNGQLQFFRASGK